MAPPHLGFGEVSDVSSFRGGGLIARTLFLEPSKNIFVNQQEKAVTSARLPMMRGVRWWMSVGGMSRMREFPLVARPPACSAMKARGLAS